MWTYADTTPWITRSIRHRPRVHGHVGVLRPRRRERSRSQRSSRALELGCNFLDTADMYGPFTNERTGRQGNRRASRRGRARHQVRERAPRGRLLRRHQRPAGVRLGPLRRVAVPARRRPHRPVLPAPRRQPACRSRTPSAPWPSSCKPARSATSACRRRARRRSGGPSAVHPISALQTEYSLFTRDVEAEILPTVRELGIGFVAYSPLGRGFLTGSIKSAADLPESDSRASGRFPRFAGENFDHNVVLVGIVEQLAVTKGCTPGQLALAWVLAQGEDIVPIPGTKRRATWRRTWPPLTSSSRPTTSPGWTRTSGSRSVTATPTWAPSTGSGYRQRQPAAATGSGRLRPGGQPAAQCHAASGAVRPGRCPSARKRQRR